MATAGPAFSMDSFMRTFNSKIEPPVREHLKCVYACLTMSALSAALGAYIHVFTDLLRANFFTSLGALGLLVALMMTPDDGGKNATKRLGLFLGFSFATGLGLGPLLDLAIAINPSIVVSAFLGTSVIFACFSLSALYAPRGQFLFLGAPLLSLFSLMSMLFLANIFFGFYWVYQAQLYVGLLIMCGFVLYDTQLIVEKRRLGDRDFIWHSVDLFIDFVNIFRRLLIVLAQKDENQRKRRN